MRSEPEKNEPLSQRADAFGAEDSEPHDSIPLELLAALDDVTRIRETVSCL